MPKIVITTGLLGVLVLVASLQPTHAEDSKADPAKRIRRLEQRVTTLERLVLGQSATSNVGVAEAEARLAAAEEKLRHTERLHRKGFTSKLQLEADRFVVANARKALQLAGLAQRFKKAVLEIGVLDAQHSLTAATETLKHSERLRSKGYVSDVRVKADRSNVELAARRLKRARAALKANERPPKDATKKK